MHAPHSGVYSRGARPSCFSFGVGRGGTSRFPFFCLFFFFSPPVSPFSFFSPRKGEFAPRSAGAQKRGREGGGKGSEACRGCTAYRLQGEAWGSRGVWGGGTAISHTHSLTHTHTLPEGLGGGRLGREQSSLKTSVLLIMHQSSREEKKKENARAGRGDAKLPSPPSSSEGEKVSPDAASVWEAWYEAKLCFDRLCSTLPLSSSKICKEKKKTKRIIKKKVFCKVGVFCCKVGRGAVKNQGEGKKKKEEKKSTL